jgi:hypothetical protein
MRRAAHFLGFLSPSLCAASTIRRWRMAAQGGSLLPATMKGRGYHCGLCVRRLPWPWAAATRSPRGASRMVSWWGPFSLKGFEVASLCFYGVAVKWINPFMCCLWVPDLEPKIDFWAKIVFRNPSPSAVSAPHQVWLPSDFLSIT